MNCCIPSSSASTTGLKVGLIFSLGLFFLMGMTCQASARISDEIAPVYECASPVSTDQLFSTCAGSGASSAILQGDTFVAMRTNPGAQAAVPVDVFGTCRYIDNVSTNGASFFIPFRSQKEWAGVISSASTGASGFKGVHCSRPFPPQDLTYPVSAPGYGGCTAAQATVSTPRSYARYPGGTIQTAGTSFSCNGSLTVAFAESWIGLDSDVSSPSWSAKQTLYGPNIALTANGQVTSASVELSDPLTLIWGVSGGNGENNISCRTSWNAATGLTGSTTFPVTPPGTTSYSVTCTDNVYNLASTAMVVVNGEPNISVSLRATPTTIDVGDKSTLSWIVTGAPPNSCSLDNGIGTVPLSGTADVKPTATTTYTLTCSNAGVSSSQSAIVTVDPLVSVNFNALPSTIESGRSSVLTWTSTNATSCSIDQGIGNVALSNPTGITVRPTATTIYKLSCQNGGRQAEQIQTITVDQSVAVTLNASPPTIVAGNKTTLTWTSSSADSCSLDGNPVAIINAAGSDVSPVTSTTYTLICTNSADNNSAQQQVMITVEQPVSASLDASPTTIISGQTATLTWGALNATSCTLNNSPVTILNNNYPVTPAATATYTLNCSNGISGAGASSAQDAKTVTVVQPVSGNFSANPTTIQTNGSSTLSWATQNASSCSISGIGPVSPAGGTKIVTLSATTPYTLTCVDGLAGTGSSLTIPLTITVCPPGDTVVAGACVAPSAAVATPPNYICSGWGQGFYVGFTYGMESGEPNITYQMDVMDYGAFSVGAAEGVLSASQTTRYGGQLYNIQVTDSSLASAKSWLDSQTPGAMAFAADSSNNGQTKTVYQNFGTGFAGYNVTSVSQFFSGGIYGYQNVTYCQPSPTPNVHCGYPSSEHYFFGFGNLFSIAQADIGLDPNATYQTCSYASDTLWEANHAQPFVAADGMCSGYDGLAISSLPVDLINLCQEGWPTAVTGGSTGPWSWSCSGMNGGHPSNVCHAPVAH